MNVWVVLWLLLLWGAWVEPVAAVGNCQLKVGMNSLNCAQLTRQLCPVRFLPYGCPNSAKKVVRQGDGGCQPNNTCPYCCQAGCLRGRGVDSRCKWTGTECITCHPRYLVENGLPILPNPNGALGIEPEKGWDTHALGDSFKVDNTCKALGQFVTGASLWMKQMNPALQSLPLAQLEVRLSVFSLPGQFLVVDWLGVCKATRYLNTLGVFQIDCDFTSVEGVFLSSLPPGSCVPSLPAGEYSLVVSQWGPTSLGWLATFPNTACNQKSSQYKQCAFSQESGGEYGLDQVDFCTQVRFDRLVENMSFRIWGSKTKPAACSL